MEYRTLGTTGLVVSRLCFGTLTISSLQAALPLDEGARVIRRALAHGVNFIDCAELYDTYGYVREALRDGRYDAIIASKCYAYTQDMMRTSLERARRELDRDCVDIFMLHEQESLLTIRGHWEAVEFLLKAREQGWVRAVGLSTHHMAAVEATIGIPEIQVVQPLYNARGVGIRDATGDQMLAAIGRAHASGKGIYGMKALGGGNLLSDPISALHKVLSRPEFDSIAVGMQSTLEVEYNVRVFNGQAVPDGLKDILRRVPRHLHIDDWCVGCGACVASCKSQALTMVDGRPRVDPERCCLCGYCAAVCPEFCIKVV